MEDAYESSLVIDRCCGGVGGGCGVHIGQRATFRRRWGARSAPSGGGGNFAARPEGGGGNWNGGKGHHHHGHNHHGHNHHGHNHHGHFHRHFHGLVFGFAAPYYYDYAPQYYSEEDCYEDRYIRGAYRRVWVCEN